MNTQRRPSARNRDIDRRRTGWQAVTPVRIVAKVSTLFVCIIIPIMMTNILLFNWIATLERRNNYDFIRTQINAYIMEIENKIVDLTNMQNLCINSRAFRTLSAVPEMLRTYEQQELKERIRDNLVTIRLSNGSVSAIQAYIASMNQLVSSEEVLWTGEKSAIEIRQINEMRRTRPGASIYIFYDANACNIYLCRPDAVRPIRSVDTVPFDFVNVELDVAYFVEQFRQRLQPYAFSVGVYQSDGAGVVTEDGPLVGDAREFAVGRRVRSERALGLSTDPGSPYQPTAGKTAFAARSDRLGVDFIFLFDRRSFTNSYYAAVQVVVIVLTLVIVAAAISTVVHIMRKPFQNFVLACRTVDRGDAFVRIEYEPNDVFSFVYIRFNRMVERIEELVRTSYEREVAVQRSRLEQMQSIIRSHFLYNSLYFIYRMNQAGPDMRDAVGRFALKLSSYYRYINKTVGHETSLRDEIDHARTYAELHNERYRDKVLLDFGDIPSECKTCMVPPLIIQPAVENIFKHAFTEEMDHKTITVRTTKPVDKQLVTIRIQDNGKGVSPALLSEINLKLSEIDDAAADSGLLIVRRRLTVWSGGSGNLHLEPGENGGLSVVITVPLQPTPAGIECFPEGARA